MPTFQVEMLWDCSSCKTTVKGRHKACTNCGKAKEGEPFYDDPSHGEVGLEDAVLDPELIRQAEAGPDWQCRYCGSHSRRDDGECRECGSLQGNSRDTETRWDDGTTGKPGDGPNDLEEAKFVVDRGLDEALSDWSEPLNGGPRKVMGRHELPPPPLPSRRRWIVPTAVATVLGAAFLIFFLFRTREVQAEVVATRWDRTVSVDRYQVVTEEGWDPPDDSVSTEDLGRRVHHYDKVLTGYKSVDRQEKYACGEDCRTTPRTCHKTPVRCQKNDNGFKTCSGGDEVCSGGDKVCSTRYCTRTVTDKVPQYVDEPVMRTWWRWKGVRAFSILARALALCSLTVICPRFWSVLLTLMIEKAGGYASMSSCGTGSGRAGEDLATSQSLRTTAAALAPTTAPTRRCSIIAGPYKLPLPRSRA